MLSIIADGLADRFESFIYHLAGHTHFRYNATDTLDDGATTFKKLTADIFYLIAFFTTF